MSFPKIGTHYSQIILNTFATYYSQNYSSIIYKGLYLSSWDFALGAWIVMHVIWEDLSWEVVYILNCYI